MSEITPHLWEHIPQICPELHTAASIYLMLDIDGTLAPIAKKPELAVIPEQTMAVLDRLNSHHCCRVAVISGRSLPDCLRMIKGLNIAVAGNHGLEIESGGRLFIHPEAEAARPDINKICRRLEKALAEIPGIIIENKGLTASVHCRLTPAQHEQNLKLILEEEIKKYRGLNLQKGNKIWELRPKIDWDKGKAVLHLLKNTVPRANNPLPLYAGDDSTDEDAFLALRGKGITVLVSPEPRSTGAMYYLRSPAEVHRTLQLLEQSLLSK